MHGCLIAFIIPVKMLAELGVTVTIGTGDFVFLPKQKTGYPVLAKLFIKIWEPLFKIRITSIRNSRVGAVKYYI